MHTYQFISFRLDTYLAGISILKVREINRLVDITPVQHAPEYVRGLINLRGQTVTVFDLGIRLGLGPRTITEDTHNIILKGDAVGLLVDNIGDVVDARDSEIKAPPANLGGIAREFIESVVKLDQELMIVLSSENILELQVSQQGG